MCVGGVRTFSPCVFFHLVSHTFLLTILSTCVASVGEMLVRQPRYQQQQANDTSGTMASAPKPGDDVTQQPVEDWIVFIFYDDGSLLTVSFLTACVLAVVFVLLLVGIAFSLCRSNSEESGLLSPDFFPEYGFRTDGKLATSAQLFHYHHQKQQIIAAESASAGDKSDEESEDGDMTRRGSYTVYECPGLAPMEEMEVRNPNFDEEDDALSSTSSLSTRDKNGTDRADKADKDADE